MGKLFRSIAPAIRDIFFVILIVFLFTCIFAMFGISILGDKMYSSDGTLVRNNFDNFLIAFITVFQLMTPGIIIYFNI